MWKEVFTTLLFIATTAVNAGTDISNVIRGQKPILLRGGSQEGLIVLSKDDMKRLLSKARQRHNDAIQTAKESYWYTDDDGGDKSINSPIPSLFDTYTMDSPPWSIPDFPDVLTSEKSSCIHVTKGASSKLNDATSTPLFTPEECNYVISQADLYFNETNNGNWEILRSGRFPICGFWIKTIPSVHKWFNEMLQQRLFPTFVKLFPDFVQNVTDLVCDNAYLFKYTPGKPERMYIFVFDYYHEVSISKQ